MNKRTPPEMQRLMKDLILQGKSSKEVAEICGCTKKNVYNYTKYERWLVKHPPEKPTPPPQAEESTGFRTPYTPYKKDKYHISRY